MLMRHWHESGIRDRVGWGLLVVEARVLVRRKPRMIMISLFFRGSGHDASTQMVRKQYHNLAQTHHSKHSRSSGVFWPTTNEMRGIWFSYVTLSRRVMCGYVKYRHCHRSKQTSQLHFYRRICENQPLSFKSSWDGKWWNRFKIVDMSTVEKVSPFIV